MVAHHKDSRITIGRLELFLPPFPTGFLMMVSMLMTGFLAVGGYFKRLDGDFGRII